MAREEIIVTSRGCKGGTRTAQSLIIAMNHLKELMNYFEKNNSTEEFSYKVGSEEYKILEKALKDIYKVYEEHDYFKKSREYHKRFPFQFDKSDN